MALLASQLSLTLAILPRNAEAQSTGPEGTLSIVRIESSRSNLDVTMFSIGQGAESAPTWRCEIPCTMRVPTGSYLLVPYAGRNALLSRIVQLDGTPVVYRVSFRQFRAVGGTLIGVGGGAMGIGLAVAIGAGVVALNSLFRSAPDLTPWFLASGASIAIGAVLMGVGVALNGNRTAGLSEEPWRESRIHRISFGAAVLPGSAMMSAMIRF